MRAVLARFLARTAPSAGLCPNIAIRSLVTEPFYGSPREGKTPLSPLQSITLAVYSATNAFINPEKHDMVATLSEVTGTIALQNMYNDMMADPTGQRILTDRPVVDTGSINIEELEKLPTNTFGYGYAMFLKKNGFNPDERAEVKYIADEELAYVMNRYRQSHDFYHVVTDLSPSMPGELALKYAELFQTGLPVCALSATVGSLKLEADERKIWKDKYLPWAIRVGKGKKWLNVYWEEEFETDLSTLRDKIGVVAAAP
eukprot:scaffold2708_cov190-Chaetoceros_neogracile.AAC.2